MKHLLVLFFSIMVLFCVTNPAFATKENHVLSVKPNFLESVKSIDSIVSPNYLSDPNNSIYSLKYEQYEYFIPYQISNASIEKMNLSCKTSSLLIYLQGTNDGNLTVSIPRQMLSPKAGYGDADFIVLLDKEEAKFEETEPYLGSRTLDISFTRDSKMIEIIATQWPESFEEYPTCVTVDSDESIYYRLLSPLKQLKSEIPVDEIRCKEELELILKSSNGSPVCVKPETKQMLIERGWAKPTLIENMSNSKYAEIDVAQKLLTQNQIEYVPDKLVVTSGPVIDGDPRCGAVIDVNSMTHWFVIDSITKPQKMTLYSENPNPCKVNMGSCFCDAQIELAALTLHDLSYFSPEEEEKVANMLIDYLEKENINRTPKFLIGKFNLNYTDPSAIGYCGELWGYNKYDFFVGGIVNDQVADYGLESELSPLCAISEGAKWWEKK